MLLWKTEYYIFLSHISTYSALATVIKAKLFKGCPCLQNQNITFISRNLVLHDPITLNITAPIYFMH